MGCLFEVCKCIERPQFSHTRSEYSFQILATTDGSRPECTVYHAVRRSSSVRV